jgi:NhaP-type Na+/H+ or K+/H+ antiporter
MLTATLLLIGSVLVVMGLGEPLVRRLPLSPALVYLLTGWAMAALATPLLPELDLIGEPGMIRLFSEGAVLLSLFAIGLKIRMPLRWVAWRTPVLLATTAMLVAIGLATLAARALLPMDWAMAFLLATLLAPTDPVLASDVQVHDHQDRDLLRLSLSAEGALNDGTAYPLVMLALGLLGWHTLGERGGQWIAWDLAWSVGAGVLLGIACGRGIGRLLRHKLRAAGEAEWDELLYLGAIMLTYGLALLIHASAFLAVFAAGATLLRPHPGATHEFGASCERLVEALMVLLIGAAMTAVDWSWGVVGFSLVMVLAVRPLSVLLGLPPSALPRGQRAMVAWFGIRGVGSVFYLAVALEMGISGGAARELASACLACIALSIGLHGVSATPLMAAYHRRRGHPPAPPPG